MSLANQLSEMRFVEFAVLYFSMGSAFGAHRFIVTRARVVTRFMFAASAAAFWPAILLSASIRAVVHGIVVRGFDLNQESDSFTADLSFAQRDLEKALTENSRGGDLFRLRDTLTRYKGLTLADHSTGHGNKTRLSDVTDNSGDQLHRICLARRNHNRLSRHRNNARAEFIETVVDFVLTSGQPERAGSAALNYATLLEDTEAVAILREHLAGLRQTRRRNSVLGMENNTWLPQKRQPTQRTL